MEAEIPFDELIVDRMDVFDDGAKALFTFKLNGKRIFVSIFAKPYGENDDDEEETVEDRLIELLTDASDDDLDFCEDEDIEFYEKSVDEAAHIVMDIGRIPFSQVAPPLIRHDYEEPKDLHHAMFPETFDFRLETIHDTAFMYPITPGEAAKPRDDGGPDPNLNIDFLPDPKTPRYSTKDIIVEKEYKYGLWVREVRVGSETMVCKAFPRGLEYEYLAPELKMLQMIEKVNTALKTPLRVPLLKGYVVHPVTEAILGLLRTRIPPSQYGNSISDAGKHMSKIPVDIRRRWLQQITETVNALHKVGLVWGDAKPGNVCINPDNNAWLIDFGGGWTQRWADKGIAGTVEGDKHALTKIKAFLLFKCPEMTQEQIKELFYGVFMSSSE
ncbi:uncharacterized protein FIESC28_10594 [Fusarium coffeatum]|uniref:Protein kinase domain-containing protein n=1 Tax=Fusarium coffeatum TaxID=231269 RepID=A0A366QRK7_9HYPO|nr:uncharacterized protein FIESC28_10594 [Fusarium coffeatum]RBR07513.1 hypothetical protein FIESC28_10594 [Fusarium coffeatum]